MMYIHHKKITKGNFETNGQCGRLYYANSVDIINAVGTASTDVLKLKEISVNYNTN